ncbi:oxidoreductase- short chain dehydrogenase/reductase family protein [Apiospora rasikravindrae]|uniref:Oxidoreductase- short chain dehydrogenase/reductase family protein n=1 Tax=Apiospora rasikravindrae TaxID=990691 RepID=A0ABR1SMV5_9PEZI
MLTNTQGHSTALALAIFGAYVSICGRDSERLARVEAVLASASPHGAAGAMSYQLDIADEAQVEAWIQATADKFPGTDCRKKLDGATNAASLEVPEAVPITEMRASTWQAVLDANLTGVFYSMRAEHRRMEAGAAVVNVGSILGIVGMECYAPYTAAKHGVLGLTRAAAKEWGSKGIRINTTGPAMERLKEGAVTEMPDVAAHTIQGRVAEAHEQAKPILFLLSDYSSFISGQNLPVDGGWVV